jgi:hypothetical protein
MVLVRLLFKGAVSTPDIVYNRDVWAAVGWKGVVVACRKAHSKSRLEADTSQTASANLIIVFRLSGAF